jgi:hypothetical protein
MHPNLSVNLKLKMESSYNQDYLERLVLNPSESLSVEIKRWIDPQSIEGKAKIIKACIALRNNNGGTFLVGFNNDGSPDIQGAHPNPRESFHPDVIQAIASKFCSDAFEVKVHYLERDGQEYPALEIPSGITTPVAAKTDLHEEQGNKYLIKIHTVYVRSLNSNNIVSSAEARHNDWKRIMDLCFENREADIGRFLRRHLGGLTPSAIRDLVSTLSQGIQPEKSIEDILKSYLQESEERFASVVRERHLTLPNHGAWEVGLIIIGEVPAHSANQQFLNLLSSANPQYSSWLWLDTRGLIERDRPYLYNNVWESLYVHLNSGLGHDLDFMRFDPEGKFYLRQALTDDISASNRAPEPMKVLDFVLPIIRTAEVIAVGLEFARAMGCNPDKTKLAFAFKWTKLRERSLVSWVNPERSIWGQSPAYQDEVLEFVNIPLETPPSALAQYVNQAVSPLFAVFGGFELSIDVIEDLTRRLIERRW